MNYIDRNANVSIVNRDVKAIQLHSAAPWHKQPVRGQRKGPGNNGQRVA